jgi:CheY-like chemotaxis protein
VCGSEKSHDCAIAAIPWAPVALAHENTWLSSYQHSPLVHHAKPVSRSDHRISGRAVFQSAERLGRQRDKMSSKEKIMNRTIEANFFPPAVEPIKEKASILIIDNNRDFTHSAKLTLERTGRYFVSEENDASKAHQTAQGLKPDLILLDIAMPETDGGEVAARIQSDPALHRIPIVFLTALVTKAEGKSGLRLQGHPFLAKPISLPELIEGIEKNLPARTAL